MEKYKLEELEKILTEKQKLFCKEYVKNGWNIVKSYLAVYKDCKTYNSAGVLGHNLLKNVKIKQYIDFIKEDFEFLCGISKASQIKEYQKVAYSSLTHINKSWIERKEWDEIKKENPDALDAIESIDTKMVINKEGEYVEYVKVKLYDKVKALERIDILMGFKAPEKIEMSGNITQSFNLEALTPTELQTMLSIARKSAQYE